MKVILRDPWERPGPTPDPYDWYLVAYTCGSLEIKTAYVGYKAEQKHFKKHELIEIFKGLEADIDISSIKVIAISYLGHMTESNLLI